MERAEKGRMERIRGDRVKRGVEGGEDEMVKGKEESLG